MFFPHKGVGVIFEVDMETIYETLQKWMTYLSTCNEVCRGKVNHELQDEVSFLERALVGWHSFSMNTSDITMFDHFS